MPRCLGGDRREQVRLGVHEQELLLDPDRELAAERVVHYPTPTAARAAIRPITSAAARPLA